MQYTALVALVVIGVACADDEVRHETRPASENQPPVPTGTGAGALGNGDAELSPAEIERGRRDSSWRRYLPPRGGTVVTGSERSNPARSDSAGREAAADRPGDPAVGDASGTAAVESTAAGEARTGAAQPERWSDISPEALNTGDPVLRLSGDAEGPSVARIQILLDRTRFSPGVIDGYWGKNTEKAVYWLQRENGLEPTGTVDAATYETIARLAGGTAEVARQETLTAEHVAGPFVSLPDDVYERADLDCLCYGSLREKLAEVFHTTPELLEQLNPGISLGSLAAGDALHVPAVDPFLVDDTASAGGGANAAIARIVVSDGGHYVHAVGGDGRGVYHHPSTLGSEYAPSPTGDYRIARIAWHPTWHYQPKLLTGEPDHREDAVLPPGPNNAVGVVWMDLSKPHYGIHGTGAPETIGYATSHGCVRLTNWDAAELAKAVESGVPVEFTDAAR